MDKTLFWFFILLVALSQLGGHALGFYESIYEYDCLVHYVGGIFAGIIGLIFCGPIFRDNATKSRHIFYAIFSSFIIGMLWENYQFYILGMAYGSYDTILDLAMDTLGGSTVAVYYALRFN